MLYLVFSDSHGDVSQASWIIEQFKDRANGVIHLGDHADDFHKLQQKYQDKYGMAFLNVRGNCDLASPDPDLRTFTVEKRKVLLVHGHQQHVSYGTAELKMLARQNSANVVLFGHTHIPFLSEEEGLLILNPGSISSPRGGSRAGFALLELENGKAAAILNRYEDFS